MSRHWKTGSTCGYLFSLVLLFMNCSPVWEKTEPKVHTIEIKQMKFQPSELTVQKGDTVVWINQDIVAPIRTMLSNETENTREQVWNNVTEQAKLKYSDHDSGHVKFVNEAICIVGHSR